MQSEHYKKFAATSKHSWIHSEAYREFWARAIIRKINLKKADRILDLGAGRGELAAAISKILRPSTEIICVDPSKPMLASVIGLESVRAGALQYLAQSQNCSFSAVIMKQVIHHVAKTKRATLYRELHRVATPNGRVIILTMPETIFYPMIPAVITHFEQKQIRHSEISEGLKAVGFTVSAEPLDFPVQISWMNFADAIRERFLSDLRPFSISEIEIGLKKLRKSLKNPEKLAFNDRLVMFVGQKG